MNRGTPEQPSPRTAQAERYGTRPEERNATLERLNSTNGPLAKLRVRGNIGNLQLVTSGCPRARGSVSGGLIFF